MHGLLQCGLFICSRIHLFTNSSVYVFICLLIDLSIYFLFTYYSSKISSTFTTIVAVSERTLARSPTHGRHFDRFRVASTRTLRTRDWMKGIQVRSYTVFFFSKLCWGKATVAYTKPQQRKKEESEQLRG